MATAFLSLLKCFNGAMVAASRMLFGLGRRGLVRQAAAFVHPDNQTPSTAVLWLGAGTGIILFGGESFLVPLAEVGSVTAAAGWLAACASYAFMKPSGLGRASAFVGILITGLLVVMKLIPGVPGAFSMYEWIAMAVWCSIGLLLHVQPPATR